MNVMHKLAWAAVLASSGVPTVEMASPQLAAPVPARPRVDPVPPPAPAPTPLPAGEGWPLELDEDEFEGEGWSFWPLSPRP